jgi:stage III sporulation protein AG
MSSTGTSKTSNIKTKNAEVQETTITSYVSNMESKLEKILSQVQGASNVNVMVTLDMSSSTIQNNEIQLATFPNIKGVVIVANGVENTSVKMNILKAVQAVIDISSGRIEILSSN